MLLGAIVRDITDPFFAFAIEALAGEARARGYNVVLGLAHGKADEATVVEERHVDAIVVLGDVTDHPSLIADLTSIRVPVVALWQGSLVRGIPAVNVENDAGIRLALDHLAERGHDRIAFIGGPNLGDIEERRNAYLAYMRDRGTLVEGYVQDSTNTLAGGRLALKRLLDQAQWPTAVVAATDVLAIGALNGAHQAGLAVPRDLSVTGFDDTPLAAYTVPPLTTLRMPVADMVAEAVRLAIDEAQDHSRDGSGAVRVLLPTLVPRESTGSQLLGRPQRSPRNRERRKSSG